MIDLKEGEVVAVNLVFEMGQLLARPGAGRDKVKLSNGRLGLNWPGSTDLKPAMTDLKEGEDVAVSSVFEMGQFLDRPAMVQVIEIWGLAGLIWSYGPDVGSVEDLV
ncbi:hypothetical protein Tco_1102018 [Tanacetum coccineum]